MPRKHRHHKVSKCRDPNRLLRGSSNSDLDSRSEPSTNANTMLPSSESVGTARTEATNLTDEEELLVTQAMMHLSDAIEAMPLRPQQQSSSSRYDHAAADPANQSTAARKHRISGYLTGYLYGLTEGEERLFMYHALRSHSFDIKAAVTSLMATVEFRKRQNLNRMVLFPSLVPTRGYNERGLCETLHLPFLQEWQVTASSALHASGAFHPTEELVGEDGRLVTNRGNDMDTYYQASYSDYFDSTQSEDSSQSPLGPHFSSGRPLTCPTFGSGAHDGNATRRASDITAPLALSTRSLQGSSAALGSSLACDSGVLDPAEVPLPPLSPTSQPPLVATPHESNRRGVHEGHSRDTGDHAVDVLEPTDGSTGPLGHDSHEHCVHSVEERGQPQPQPSRGFFGRMLTHALQLFPDHLPHPLQHHEAATSSSSRALTRPELSVNTADECDARDRSTGDRAVDAAQLIDQQTAIFVNTDGIARTLLARSPCACSDSLDFHALLQPIVAVVLHYFPTCFHFWDKQGRPIMYVKLRLVDAKKVVNELFKLTPVSTEPKALALLYHAYSLEIMMQLIRFNHRKNQRDNEIRNALLSDHPFEGRGTMRGDQVTVLPPKEPTNSCVVVIDCAHVRLKRLFYKPLIQIVKPLISLDQRHYPDLLHHLYVVNCNPAVNLSYLAIRGVIKEGTRKKVTFATRRNSTETLKEVIDSDLLPAELGGRCECPGGCIPEFHGVSDTASCSSAPTSEAFSGATDSLSESFALSGTLDSTMNGIRQKLNCTVEKFIVSPGKKWSLSFPVSAHEEIFWEFRCRNHRSVMFSVIYIPVTAEGGIFSLSSPARVKDGASHYICPDPGTVILHWENKYSKTRKVDIHAKIYRDGFSNSTGS